MTVLPKDNDEHPCHFAMETPFGGGGGEVSGRILIKFDPGAPQLRTKVLLIHPQSLPHSMGQVREDLVR